VNRIIECLTTIETKDGRHRKLMVSDFKSFGKDVEIYPQAKIIKPEVIEIGDYSRIDDFCFIYGGQGIKIGNCCHLGAYTSIVGGGYIEFADFVGVAQYVQFVNGANDYRDPSVHMTQALHDNDPSVIRKPIYLEKDVLILSKAIILPGVRIGEGAVVGALSMVNKDVAPWDVVAGIPARVIGNRPRVIAKDKIQRFRDDLGRL